jgi:hypothetical protein
MTEQASSPEEREQGPEYEVYKLVELNEMAQELYDVATGVHGSDVAPSDATLDVIEELALAMTRRQGVEFGKLLVRKLYERTDIRREEAPHTNEAWKHEMLAEAIDRELFRMGVFEPDEGPEEPDEH